MSDITLQEPEKPAQRKTRGRPETNMRALARDYSVQALQRLAELMYDENHCVALGATRTLLERGHGKEPMEHVGKRIRGKPKQERLNVKITRLVKRSEHDA